jgi:6-pyruvoyltetrahydropterin/6-carboxytetrahydropterin synthase
MYEIFVKTHFSSAHYLRDYPGKCEFLHGHNWEVEAGVRVEKLDSLGMGIDFRDLKSAVAVIMKELDHRNLNEHPAFQDVNPSSEHIAAYVYRRLGEELKDFSGVSPAFVTVYETPGSGVRYFGE